MYDIGIFAIFSVFSLFFFFEITFPWQYRNCNFVELKEKKYCLPCSYWNMLQSYSGSPHFKRKSTPFNYSVQSYASFSYFLEDIQNCECVFFFCLFFRVWNSNYLLTTRQRCARIFGDKKRNNTICRSVLGVLFVNMSLYYCLSMRNKLIFWRRLKKTRNQLSKCYLLFSFCGCWNKYISCK